MTKRHLFSRLVHSAPSRIATKRIVSEFADAHGLVYFGYVSQHGDEHKLIRGLTVSTSHHDQHYAVGTSDGYDISLVERSERSHTWLIMSFDLHETRDIPHVFIGPSNSHDSSYQRLFAYEPHFHPAVLGVLGQHSPDFTDHFTIYCSPTHALEIERILTPAVTELIGRHFRTLAVEIHEGSLYVYADNAKLNPALLSTMLQNGLWLAKTLDSKT